MRRATRGVETSLPSANSTPPRRPFGIQISSPLEHQTEAYEAIHDAVVADGDHRDASGTRRAPPPSL